MRYLVILLFLSACSATGPTFNGVVVSNDKATVIVYIKSWQSGAPASIGWPVDVNGISGCSLHMNGYLSKQIDPGQITISSSVFTSPGTSRITFNANPANVYYIMIELDEMKNVAAFSGGLAGQIIAEGLSSTGGPFLLTKVDPKQAKNDLKGLKQDCI